MVYHLDLVREMADVNCDAYMVFYHQHVESAADNRLLFTYFILIMCVHARAPGCLCVCIHVGVWSCGCRYS